MIPSLFFTANIQHAFDLSAVMRSRGVRVYPLSGKTPDLERKRLVRLMREGAIDGLASCDVLSTGTDIPIAMGAFMARSTKSGLWYRQAVGRVLRPYPAPQGERLYQKEAIRAIARALKQGVVNQLMVLPTGCHTKGQDILMYDGSVKKVEDVIAGDQLMGPDSKPRKVLQLCRGSSGMKTIVPTKGEAFTVNDHHIMTLVRTQCARWGSKKGKYPSTRGGAVTDICLHEYMGKSKAFKHIHKLFRVGVEFPFHGKLSIPPYILGLLLGDGSFIGGVGLSGCDEEPMMEFCKYCASMGLRISPKGEGTSTTWVATWGIDKHKKENPLNDLVRAMGLWGCPGSHKYIPHWYKVAPRKDRLEMLAGLIDSDGSCSQNRYYDFISQSKELACDVTFLARSLGMAAYMRPCEKHCQTGNGGTYYRVGISGDLTHIPCRIPRKKAMPRRQKKDVLRRAFTVKDAGFGEYFGFTLDGDGRYLMGDFTVTHNTGKTTITAKLPPVLKWWRGDKLRGRILFLVHREELATQTADTFRAYNPDMKIGIEKAGSYADDADLVIGSIQTIGPDNGKRLAAFNPAKFDAVITDECHWMSKLHANIYRHFHVLKGEERDPGILHLGMTATPQRSDGIGLEKHYDEIVFVYDIRAAIKDNWLARITAYRSETTVDVSDVSTRDGDFSPESLAKAINTPERNEIIAQKYLEVCALEHLDVQCWTPPPDWKKDHAVIVDFADLSGRHSLIGAASLFGLRANYDAKGKDLVEQVEEIEAIEQEHPALDLRSAPNMAAIRATLQSVDLLAAPVVPPEIGKHSRFSWLADGPGAYHLGLMDHKILTVRENTLGQWEVYEHSRGVATHLGIGKTLKEALAVAEKQIPAIDARVLKVGAKWQGEPPSDKQAFRIWQIDQRVRKHYPSAPEFYAFCRSQYESGNESYSKGGLSRSISSISKD